MSDKKGYIKLYRQLTENEIYFSEPFTRTQAWIDLLLLANHKENKLLKRGIWIPIKRGQVGYSMLALSKRWQWSEKKVKRFLEYLKNDEQIDVQNCNVTTTISILNYEKYQGIDEQTSEQKTNRRRTEDEQKQTNNNDKECNNNDKEDNILLDEKNSVEDKNEENQKPKNLPQKKTKKEPDFIDGLIALFAKKYFAEFQVEYTPLAGDKKHMTWILNETKKFKKRRNEKFDTNDTVEYFNQYFSAVVKIKQPFIRNNLTVAILKSQFNQVNRILKDMNDGKNQSNPNNPSDEELINAIKQGAKNAGQ